MAFSPSERERIAGADIIANAERVARFVAGFTFETSEADERTHVAVARCLRNRLGGEPPIERRGEGPISRRAVETDPGSGQRLPP